MNHSELSKKLSLTIDKKTKKENGIYFTPKNRVESMIQFLKLYILKMTSVLEPSYGSGEFISYLHEAHPKLQIDGYELNEEIYKNTSHLNNENIRVYNEDFICLDIDKKYDLILGNPPFYVMKKKDVSVQYYDYFDGRPNIFILFILKSLTLLNPNGILAFVLPKSFLNCLYYDKTRKYIYDNYDILLIDLCKDKYIDTQQETITFIIRNTKPTNNNCWTLNIHEHIVFGINCEINRMRELYEDSVSLYTLGFKVSVGTVVWNQSREILSDDAKNTRLIYSSEIENNTLVMKKFKDQTKKNYIDKVGKSGPILLINRGYGVGEYKFNYCLVDDKNLTYLIENHIICIESILDIDDNDLLLKYNKIIESLENEKSKEFIKMYFGNNAINTTELNYILPIY